MMSNHMKPNAGHMRPACVSRGRLGAWAGVLAFALTAACASGAGFGERPPELAEALNELLGDAPGPIHYFAQQVDLNGDERAECLVHVAGPTICGTGGCSTVVFADDGTDLRLVTRIGVNRPPIAVAETSTSRWRDLVVRVSGGGIEAHDARLRYDGSGYPENPTVAPAERLDAGVERDVVIPGFQSFTEGTLLRSGS